MKKLAILASFLLVFVLSGARGVRAYEVSPSASLRKDVLVTKFDYRVVILQRFLEQFGSPLADYAPVFVNYADTYGIDYRLVPAISGVESTFGKFIPYKSFNAYGWAGGDYRFKSWEESINEVSMTLKTQYIDKGAASIGKIARIYAPPSTTWGYNVSYFVRKIDALPVSYDI